MLDASSGRMHAYLFVQSNVLQNTRNNKQASTVVAGLASLMNRTGDDVPAINAIAQHPVIVEAITFNAIRALPGNTAGLNAVVKLLSTCAPSLLPNVRAAVLNIGLPAQLQTFLNAGASTELQAAGFLIWLCYPRLELDPMHAVVHDSKLLQTIVDVASRSSEALSNGKVSDLKLAQVLVCFHCMRALSLFHSHNAILSIL